MNRIQQLALGSFLVLAGSLGTAARGDTAYKGSRFSEVWSVTQENPYKGELPRYEVSIDSFYDFLKDRLQQASERTLSTRSDILPPFRKLVHPHGICLSGTWNITEKNPYSGYFRQGTQGLIIVRASAASSAIYPEEKRILGFSGKIFPTIDRAHAEPLETANFFTIDNLGGTYIPHFRETMLTNDITFVNVNDAESLQKTPLLAAVGKAFRFAEKVLNSVITIRQNYQISELGESAEATIITPKWLAVKARPGDRSQQHRDFRDELRLENNGGSLIFDIFVDSEGIIALKKGWQKIGYIELNEYTISQGCDERLHFNHPGWRNDLIHSPEDLGYERS